MMRISEIGLALLFFAAPLGASEMDPLFRLMMGNWEASGERVQLVSGRKITLHAEVSSELQGKRLVSKNAWTEISQASNGNPSLRQYELNYWIQAVDGHIGQYELGMVDPSDPEAEQRVTATGTFSQEGFAVEQRIPSNPPMRVQSFTKFLGSAETGQTSETTQAVFLGDRQISRAEIHYAPRVAVSR